jgi:hypothetical protein
MIQLRDFYLIGGILMLVTLVANLYSLYFVWGNLNIGGKVASIAGTLLFNLLFCVMFFFLYKTTPKMNLNSTIVDSPELDKFLEEVSKNVP